MDGVNKGFIAVMGLGVCLGTSASSLASAGETMSWEERRLFQPTVSQRKQEYRGGVFIYDGLTFETVQRAMDEHFDRIDNMMFVRVKHPPPEVGGEPEVEDDGCD